MSSALANPHDPSAPADRCDLAGHQAQGQAQPQPRRRPTIEWPLPPSLGSADWLDLHEQARTQAQALRREAMVQAWAEVDRAWAATHRSAGRAARRLAQRLRQHWQRREDTPPQRA